MRTPDSQPQDFVVVAPTRSGSTWLMDRINNVPGAQGHMELFNHLPSQAPPRAGCNDYSRFVEIGNRFAHGIRPFAVFGYLDALYARPEAVGFKLMYPFLRQYPELLLYLSRRKIAVIHLVRNNHLDVILSEQLAGKTGRFHATKDEEFKQKDVVSLDPVTVAARVRWLDRKQRIVRGMLRMLPNPMHEVSYEALCADNAPFIELCDFIGMPGELEDRSGSRLVKTQTSAHREVISNYQEVRSALDLAGYRHLLQ